MEDSYKVDFVFESSINNIHDNTALESRGKAVHTEKWWKETFDELISNKAISATSNNGFSEENVLENTKVNQTPEKEDPKVNQTPITQVKTESELWDSIPEVSTSTKAYRLKKVCENTHSVENSLLTEKKLKHSNLTPSKNGHCKVGKLSKNSVPKNMIRIVCLLQVATAYPPNR